MRFSVENVEPMTQDDLIDEVEGSAVAISIVVLTLLAVVVIALVVLACLYMSVGTSPVVAAVIVLYGIVVVKTVRTASKTRKK